MKEKILLIGGGGHCKVVIDAVNTIGMYSIEGIIDNKLEKGDNVLLGVNFTSVDDIGTE